MNKIQACITSFQRSNGLSYLGETERSLGKTGINAITLFGKGHPRNDWANAAEVALDVAFVKNETHILMCQDDILIAKGMGKFLENLKWRPEIGCLSLYKSSRYDERLDSDPPGFKLDPISTTPLWGACALLFSVEILESVIRNKHFLDFPGRADIDRAVCDAVHAIGLEFWILNPSAVQHIGDISTLGNHKAEGWRQASSFIGEDGSCEIYSHLWE